MNPKDKKNFKLIKEAVRTIEPGIYSEERIGELLQDRGINVNNMNSVLQAVLKRTPYLEHLNNGNYRRTEKR